MRTLQHTSPATYAGTLASWQTSHGCVSDNQCDALPPPFRLRALYLIHRLGRGQGPRPPGSPSSENYWTLGPARLGRWAQQCGGGRQSSLKRPR
eukprot:11569948-Alexandrium_andersonii.AAC.1